MKAKKVPSDRWEIEVYVGTENGEKKYERIEGDSEEEVKAKAKVFRRKRMLDRQNKWQGENKERLSIVFDKGTKERIGGSGMTLNSFIRMAVENELNKRGL